MPSNLAQLADDNDLTIDMLSQYAYCPRRFHLMYVQGRWADNAFTVEGRNVHRRVDQLDHVLPDVERADAAATAAKTGEEEASTEAAKPPAGDEPPTVTRSVALGSESLGLTAKLDLVSTADQEAVPVETKRGRVPQNEERSYEPERVQLMAQGLLLREHGYQCDHGVLYFAASRTRVDVPFTPELECRTRDLLAQARQAATAQALPPPLDDSPKCNGCSLAGICLPDETLALRSQDQPQAEPVDVRRLYPIRDDALPLYVQEQGATVGKSGESLIIRKGGEELGRAGLKDVSQLVLCGNISVTAQTLHLLCQEGIPVVHLTSGHWFCGLTTGITLRNAFVRSAQFQAAADPARCLALAKAIVSAKGANQRTFLRRNASSPPAADLDEMADLLRKVAKRRIRGATPGPRRQPGRQVLRQLRRHAFTA